jgi:putative peptidoglycan lipid II flippase
MSSEPPHGVAPTTRIIARAALIMAVGRMLGRILGLMRVSVIASIFGRSLDVDVYVAAWTIPNTIYDLLINGAVSAALVPVLSEYADGETHAFSHLVSTIVNLVLITLAVLVILLTWQAPLVVRLIVQPSHAELYFQTVYLMRLFLPVTFLLCLSGLTIAILYARGNFVLPAIAGAIFNAGIVLGVLLLHESLGITSIPIGVAIGGLAQLAVQLPGLRGLRYQPLLNLRHPAVRQILWLYAPLALGLGFSVIGLLIDRRLASGFTSALATMQYAATLLQFPLGLVSTPIALAILPTLARQSAKADDTAFRETLGMALKIVLLLILPITVGVAVLSQPITVLILQYGAFVERDTRATAEAMLYYAPGLPAAAIGQVLLFACYSRKETLIPNLLQGLTILLYLLTVVPLLWLTNLGFHALIVGNSVQMIGYSVLLWWLLQRRGVSFRGLGLREAILKGGLANVVMAGMVYSLSTVLQSNFVVSTFVVLIVAVGGGGLLYIGLCIALRMEALQVFGTVVKTKMALKR